MHTDPAVPIQVALGCPDDAEPWFKANYALLNRPELGDEYTRLLNAWVTLEQKHDFVMGKGSKNRVTVPKPDVLQSWIASGRTRSRKQPVVVNIEVFAAQVVTWWGALQPEWRQLDDAGLPMATRRVRGDWGQPLDVHGQNGMLSAVACLGWWGTALGSPEARASDLRWCRLIRDVAWVCEEMAQRL
ncbi:hypothetical protein BD626DRAFT_410626 [Schizophyllum amplum]|uniref:Uncharacterized protein n=1 Tax=Schizophyllum amplum TaxID=97359 RepID=A0A550C0M3_9AGAR|nr:hypothetical protein BD626DRAFT_410626 [Auriculariopsis ampla]